MTQRVIDTIVGTAYIDNGYEKDEVEIYTENRLPELIEKHKLQASKHIITKRGQYNGKNVYELYLHKMSVEYEDYHHEASRYQHFVWEIKQHSENSRHCLTKNYRAFDWKDCYFIVKGWD